MPNSGSELRSFEIRAFFDGSHEKSKAGDGTSSGHGGQEKPAVQSERFGVHKLL